MTGLDASFLYFETPTMHLHVLGTIVVDTTAAAEPFTRDTVVHLLRERLPLLEPFRRKVQQTPLRLFHPVWLDVDVDVDSHVRAVLCPAPGSMADLASLTADFASRPLRRDRPLWEVMFVDGLQDGRAAVVLKVHHSAVDGVGAAGVLGAIFDLTPQGRTAQEINEQAALLSPPSESGLVSRLTHSVSGFATLPLGVAKLVPAAVRSVQNLVAARTSEDTPSGGAVPFVAPRAPFNGSISGRRSVAFVQVPLEDVKVIRRALGGTFNDVVIAACGGALRSFLDYRHELPATSLIAVCPVSTRTDAAAAGNSVSGMFATLGTDIADVAERYQVVRQGNDAGKADHEAIGGDLIQLAAHLAPPTATALVARIYGSMRLADLHPVVHNAIISNVPGPPIELYLAGARIEGLYPLGPVLDGPGLNITVVSYHDTLCFGFIGCAEKLPHLDELAAAVRPALAELVALAAATGRAQETGTARAQETSSA